ncbi:MAG TPA: histidine phosphatase family protein [Stellaceae bacterium]|nr:histidine phosphatase family protein [Stellaceae bacterium]
MSTLFLLRHAKAVAQHADGDRTRGLSDVGRDSARTMAAAAAERHFAPSLVLCSDAVRTRETLDIVLPALKPEPEIVYEEALYLADAKQLLQRLRRIPDDVRSVMLVGHNPGLQELAVMLSDQPTGPLMARLTVDFPTAALVRFEINLPWSALERGSARMMAILAPAVLAKR